MPFDYTTKGWPATIEIDGAEYHLSSCDEGDNGLVYAVPGQNNPHITIHQIDKEGPHDWHRRRSRFHVRVSNTKVYEYNMDGSPADFLFGGGPKKGAKATGIGSADQSAMANSMAQVFVAAIKRSRGF